MKKWGEFILKNGVLAIYHQRPRIGLLELSTPVQLDVLRPSWRVKNASYGRHAYLKCVKSIFAYSEHLPSSL